MTLCALEGGKGVPLWHADLSWLFLELLSKPGRARRYAPVRRGRLLRRMPWAPPLGALRGFEGPSAEGP